jgi:hypothetical protein
VARIRNHGARGLLQANGPTLKLNAVGGRDEILEPSRTDPGPSALLEPTGWRANIGFNIVGNDARLLNGSVQHPRPEPPRHKTGGLRVIDRWTQRKHRLSFGSLAAGPTPSPSFYDRVVWFNFRVLPIHAAAREPGALWEQSEPNDATRVRGDEREDRRSTKRASARLAPSTVDTIAATRLIESTKKSVPMLLAGSTPSLA